MWYLIVSNPDLCLPLYFKNSVSAIQCIGNGKKCGVFLPFIKLMFLHAVAVVFILHKSYNNGMHDQRGEGCQNAQNQIIIKLI